MGTFCVSCTICTSHQIQFSQIRKPGLKKIHVLSAFYGLHNILYTLHNEIKMVRNKTFQSCLTASSSFKLTLKRDTLIISVICMQKCFLSISYFITLHFWILRFCLQCQLFLIPYSLKKNEVLLAF